MQDPLFKWDGPFPYDMLLWLGITPDSTIQEINEAGFDLLTSGTPEEQDAWNELRLVKRRLLVDFFMYEMDDVSHYTGYRLMQVNVRRKIPL